ncbi:uncharacterized protein G2W53_003990 [Senna tora]|uniref:Uncharacterized protein n=1 Tax=Senna tora TaxID=362788 RepID=A0A834XBJ4_9FABA|nr:uncharacterized protein G2W53_003990 [Senna tora]
MRNRGASISGEAITNKQFRFLLPSLSVTSIQGKDVVIKRSPR